jgi:hypothetical protein
MCIWQCHKFRAQVLLPSSKGWLTLHQIYQLSNSRQDSQSWKLTAHQLVTKFPTLYGSKRFISTFTWVRHLSPPWTGHTPTHFKIHFNIIPSPMCIPSKLSPFLQVSQLLRTFRLPPYVRHAPTNWITLTTVGAQHKSWRYSVSCYFLWCPRVREHLPLNVRSQVSRPHKTGKLTARYILVFMCLDSKR